MSHLTLKRTDKFYQQKSYLNIYNVQDLSKIDSNIKPLLLRVVKKSILGTNFFHFYTKHSLYFSTILNIIMTNLNFFIFPKIFQQTKQFSFYFNDDENNSIETHENNKNINLVNNTKYMMFDIFIINLIDIIFIFVIVFYFKYKHKKINRYMEIYTQFSIDEENELMKKYFYCQIMKDEYFNIEIHKKEKTNKFLKNKHMRTKPFFYYVINIPGIKFLNNRYYKKILLPKEKEIINNIINISNEVDFKYRKKLLKFFIIMAFFIFDIPLIKKFSNDKKIENIINYFGIMILMLYVQINNFFNNKSEQMEKILLLNNKYINDGYYIYIDNQIISIFFLKEMFRNKESIEKIKNINEKLRYEFDII